MNKNILIITPFFPPQTHAAVFRAFKLVKYLKRTGWNPIVLTVNRNYLYLEDPDLLDEVQDVPIYQANYIEPTLRGLRMLLGGEDTSLKAITAKAKTIGAQSKSTDTVTSNKQSLFGKFYKYILDRWIQVPDRFRFWERSAVRMGRKIIKEHDISIIYTTCLPFTSNRIGMRLKHLTGVKWVADFRDPTTYAKRMYSDYFPVFAKQKKIEQDTFKYADAITGLSGAYLNIFNDLYEGRYSNKSYFIPTGVDDDYLPSFQNREKENYIIFVGEYLHEYKDNFLKIFAEAVNSKELKGKGCTLKIVGNKNINQKQTEEFVNDLGICNNVEYINHVPQRKLYELIVNAKAAVLIPGHTSSHDIEMHQGTVDLYLCKDGKTISNSELYAGDKDIYSTFRNRDPRMYHTIMPPYKVVDGKGDYTTWSYTSDPADREYIDIMGPNESCSNPGVGMKRLPGQNWSASLVRRVPNLQGGAQYTIEGKKYGPHAYVACRSGYYVWKNWDNWEENYNNAQVNTADKPIFKIEEILLNYAEAMYETGAFDQNVAEETINKLRTRAGVEKMTVANIDENFDPKRGKYYPKNNTTGILVDPVLWEIRRERIIELMGEGFGFYDVRRWRMAPWFVNMQQKGMWISKNELSSLTLLNETTGTSDGANGSMTEGYIYLFNDPIKEGKGWLEKYYLYQVPLEEIALNPNLTQNPGWDKE